MNRNAPTNGDGQHPVAHDLLGADEIHALAQKAGIQPTKKLGQNFMIDPSTVRRIVRISGIGPDDEVLEIGPGLGSLTLGLLEVGARVIAVEIDSRLARLLPQTVRRHQPGNAQNLCVIACDALSLTPSMLERAADGATSGTDPDTNVSRETFFSLPVPGMPLHPNRLVSNLPYNVATPLLLTLLARFPLIRTATVLVQSEVADRLTAQPGSKIYGVPSVKLAWFGFAHKAGSVSRSVFWPVPHVDSSLVSFTRTPNAANRPQELRTRTFALIDAAFGQRRKTVRAALKKIASTDQIGRAGINPGIRGEKLALDDYLRLAAICASDAKKNRKGGQRE